MTLAALLLLAALASWPPSAPARAQAPVQQVCSLLDATPDASEDYWIIWPQNWQHSAPTVLYGSYAGTRLRPDQDVTLESLAAPSTTLNAGSTHTYSAAGISELSIHAAVSFTLYACIPLAMAIPPTATPTATPTPIPTVEIGMTHIISATRTLANQQLADWTPDSDRGPLLLGLGFVLFVFGLLAFVKRMITPDEA